MFQMSYPYSPLGDRRFGANIPAADLGNRERNNTSSCFRVQLEQIDMNATPVIEVDRPHEYVRTHLLIDHRVAVPWMGLT
jgi:hypothetical protein